MLHARRDLSITARLLILAFGIVLPVILFSGALALGYAEAERAGLADRVRAKLAALAADIDRELAKAGNAGAILAATSASLRRGDVAGFREQLQRAAVSGDAEIVLADHTGEWLADGAVRVGAVLPAGAAEARIRAAFGQDGRLIAGIVESPASRRPRVAIDTPIETIDGARYLLSVALDPSLFQQILAAQGLPADWLVGVIDAAGRIVARSHDGERFFGRCVTADFWHRVQATEGSFLHVTREGVPVEAIYRRLPGSAWVVSIAVPQAALAEPARRVLTVVAGMGAGLLLLLAAVALWAGRRIASPIAALTLSAATLGRGDEPPLPPAGMREATEVGFALRAAHAQVIRRDEALRAGESRYRAIFETARDAIVVFDEAGTIGAFNRAAAALTGYAAADLVGRGIALLLAQPDRGDEEVASPPLAGAPAIGDGREIVIRHRDGRQILAELAIGEWRSAGRRQFTAMLRDLTDRERSEQIRRRLEDQLRHSQKMEAVGQLTGGIAHDFNNLLLAINLNLELLAGAVPAVGDNARRFEGAQQAVDQARGLIGQLLAFARRQPLDPISFDVSQAIIQTAPILRRTMPATIAIETKMGRNLWPAYADANQFVTVLLNLAVNARDAMHEGGRLLIEAANVTIDQTYAAIHADLSPGEYIMVALSDIGLGMPADVVERAFEPFFTTKGARGTGLGLSQVYGYARQSGGHAAIHSEPGIGTRVALYLPRGSDLLRRDARRDPVLDPVRGEAILLVEDNLLVSEAVARMLCDLGYRVIACSNGPEALAVLDEEMSIELLFTDVVLRGGITGDELAAMAQRRRPDLRVLLTSGYSEITARGGSGAGNFDLLPKPYTKVELAGRLRRAFSGEMERA